LAQTLERQIIACALALIANEEHWAQGTLAQTKSGTICLWNDAEAHRYCAVGALAKVATDLIGDVAQAGTLATEIATHLLTANKRAEPSLAQINDAEGHATVMAMFKTVLQLRADF
jgi:hypothetical protein